MKLPPMPVLVAMLLQSGGEAAAGPSLCGAPEAGLDLEPEGAIAVDPSVVEADLITLAPQCHVEPSPQSPPESSSA